MFNFGYKIEIIKWQNSKQSNETVKRIERENDNKNKNNNNNNNNNKNNKKYK